jgi:hypothetical protein
MMRSKKVITENSKFNTLFLWKRASARDGLARRKKWQLK